MPNEETRRLAELIAKAKGNMLGMEFSSNLERNFFLAEQLIENGVFSVVRCKDCSYWDVVKKPQHAGKGICCPPNRSLGGYCTRRGATTEDDYCSQGKRKDGDSP